MSTRFRVWLEAATNIALIIASLAVAVTLGSDWLAKRNVQPASGGNVAAVSVYHPGTAAPAIPGVDYSQSDRTLVLFLSTHCKYCQMSVPFYRDLTVSLAHDASKAQSRRLVAVFPDAKEEVEKFKVKEALTIASVPDIPLDGVKIQGTPTILLVSKNGRVLQVWHGAGGDAVHKAIATAFIFG
jgi:thiol-disulfide isomerase/thioredoxin